MNPAPVDPAPVNPAPVKQESRAVRAIAWLEGGSLLLLVLVAMPLKYLAHEPLMVRVVGSVHGLLVLVLVVVLFRGVMERTWPARAALKALLLSFVPFGAFYVDRIVHGRGGVAEEPPPATPRPRST